MSSCILSVDDREGTRIGCDAVVEVQHARLSYKGPPCEILPSPNDKNSTYVADSHPKSSGIQLMLITPFNLGTAQSGLFELTSVRSC